MVTICVVGTGMNQPEKRRIFFDIHGMPWGPDYVDLIADLSVKNDILFWTRARNEKEGRDHLKKRGLKTQAPIIAEDTLKFFDNVIKTRDSHRDNSIKYKQAEVISRYTNDIWPIFLRKFYSWRQNSWSYFYKDPRVFTTEDEMGILVESDLARSSDSNGKRIFDRPEMREFRFGVKIISLPESHLINEGQRRNLVNRLRSALTDETFFKQRDLGEEIGLYPRERKFKYFFAYL